IPLHAFCDIGYAAFAAGAAARERALVTHDRARAAARPTDARTRRWGAAAGRLCDLEHAPAPDHAFIARVLGEGGPLAAGDVCLQSASRRRQRVLAPGARGVRALCRREPGLGG